VSSATVVSSRTRAAVWRAIAQAAPSAGTRKPARGATENALNAGAETRFILARNGEQRWSEPQPGMVGRERRGGRHAASGAGRYSRASNQRYRLPINPRGWDQRGWRARGTPPTQAPQLVRSAARSSRVKRAKGSETRASRQTRTRACQGLSPHIIERGDSKPLFEGYFITVVSVTHLRTLQLLI